MENVDFDSPSENKGVPTTRTVDAEFVNDFIKGMIKIPASRSVKFKCIGKIPAVEVTMTHQRVGGGTTITKLSSIADEALVNAVIFAIGGTLSHIQAIKPEEHPIKEVDPNFKMTMFKKFLGTGYTMAVEKDFIAPTGVVYIHRVFSISYEGKAHFYLPKNEEVLRLLEESIA